LVAIGARTSVLGTSHQLYVITKLTNHLNAVIDGGVVQHNDSIVILRQYLGQ